MLRAAQRFGLRGVADKPLRVAGPRGRVFEHK
jgi:hypothetical protein